MIGKALRRIANDIRQGQNIDLYATVLVAFVVVALNFLGENVDEYIAPLTLAVLALLAVNMLVTRHHLEEMVGKLKDERSLLRSRSEIPSFEERGQNASEIVVVGISLLMLYYHRSFFERKLQQGCKLRFLLLDPDSQSIETFNLMVSQKGVLRDIANTFEALELLKQKETAESGKIEARLANVFLPYGIAAFDPNKKNGYMTVEPLVYKVGLDSRPHFSLTKVQNERWFEFFQEQYELLWVDSRIWEPGTRVNIPA